jgi:superfamily I DNA/RNA helicase
MSKREWSEQQQAIFNWFAEGRGNLVVRARAGTGKTTTIVEGVRHAHVGHGVRGKSLVAAFNKKIAEELTGRINDPAVEVKTLHGLGFGLVRRQWQGVRLDEEKGQRVAEKACGEQAPAPFVTLCKRLVAVAKGAAPFATEDQLLDLALDFDLVPDDHWQKAGWTVRGLAEAAHRALELATKNDGAIDFDDMVYLPVRLRWSVELYDLVVIDEAQDMNASQIALALGAVRRRGRVCVVGDDRQAIYGFRGADSGSLDRLKTELRAAELGLTITYRCPRLVVEHAARIVPDYTAAPNAPEGIVRNLDARQLYDDAKEGDFVLSRKNAELVKACLGFLRRGVRAKIEGRDVGKSLAAVLKRARNPATIPDFLRWLAQWQTTETDRLYATATPAALRRVATIEDQAECLRALAEGLTTPRELEARVASMFEDTAGKGGSNFVLCSSVHRAKGLERPRVYVLTATLYPGKGSRANVEEQNIEYVAVTRAQEELVLVEGAI